MKRVAVVGAGYVGLTTGAVLAYLGHRVTVLDVDRARVEDLREGKLPFFEPHLRELIELSHGRLDFTTRYEEVVPEADVVFIAVGTPPGPDGAPDLYQVRSASREIGWYLGSGFTVVVNKSTVPVGSGNYVEALVRRAYREAHGEEPLAFAVVSNPEFLREGQAVYDSLYPDRIVVGGEDERALGVLRELYKPILEQSFPAPSFLPRPERMGAVPLIATDLASAELIKYGANAFLAMKISFINELAALAERVGADIREVARGIGLDSRIGHRFLQAGLGLGRELFSQGYLSLVSHGTGIRVGHVPSAGGPGGECPSAAAGGGKALERAQDLKRACHCPFGFGL